ncbi:hypothetical protein GCM10011490_06600 [Pseudoclavibacter endophyticus]|nr:septum formation family protein [Pseudoclavibacter endophyticus]GGA59287.1 hypothetical protein GCM10011490_06600 [Pseudoclavibacter endophyticus]
MPFKNASTRAVASLAVAAIGLTGLAGCTLVTTLTDGGAPAPTPTPTETAEPDPTTGGEFTDTPSTDGPTDTPAEDGQQTNYFDLKVGDCFDDGETEGFATLFSSCEVPHLYEAYYVTIMEGDEFPGDDAVLEFAEDVCNNAFQNYVGSNPSNSSYSYQYITPSESTWENMNDREIMCVVTPRDGEPTTGSAQDSRR